MFNRISRNRYLVHCGLTVLAVASGISIAASVASNVGATTTVMPPRAASQALVAVRFADPDMLQSNLQFIAQRMLIPSNIPTMRRLERRMAIAGGVDNSKPVYLLMLPTGASGTELQPVLILPATRPHLAVSRLNPPAPTNGISMVVMSDGTTGYIALQRHAVLFATHREPLRMVLHEADTGIPVLAGRAERLFNSSDIAISINVHQVLKIERPRIAAFMHLLAERERANPQGETNQQKRGLKIIAAMPKTLEANVQSMVSGIMVQKAGLTFTTLIRLVPHGKNMPLVAALSQMDISPVTHMPNLPLAMAFNVQAPYQVAAQTMARELQSMMHMGAGAQGVNNLSHSIKLYRYLASHPDGLMLKGHVFMIAPTKLHDPLFAVIEDVNAKHPDQVCHMLIRNRLKDVTTAMIGQGAAAPLAVQVLKEPALTIDGATFTRVGVKVTPSAAGTNLPQAAMVKSIAGGMLKAMFGSDTMHLAVGHVGDRVILAIALTPEQLKTYVNYVKGGGIALTDSHVMVQAQKQFLPHAFASGMFDPAVLLGQVRSEVNTAAGMMQKNNAVQAGHTPVWAMSASCQNDKPEFKLFVPTESLRASSQQIHQMLLGAMTLFMQLEHPPSGA